jgi:hypothetical protein
MTQVTIEFSFFAVLQVTLLYLTFFLSGFSNEIKRKILPISNFVYNKNQHLFSKILSLLFFVDLFLHATFIVIQIVVSILVT